MDQTDITGERYSTRYSVRYGARDPWLAGEVRGLLYLVWRAIFAAWRPLIFLALLAGGAGFALRAAISLDLDPPPPPEHEQLAQAVQASVGDVHAWWRAALVEALDAPAGRAPDLALAESLAPALPTLAGRDRLARRLLIEERRSERHVEAVLRAEPGWRRDRRLEAALRTRLDAGRRAGAEPPELIFAPAPVVRRLDRARALYGPASAAVETWFTDPRGRALVLHTLPGLEDAPAGAALYGGVRDLLIQGCALSGQSGRGIAQCRVAFLPKPEGDLLIAGLSLTAAGLEGQALIGARILKAAAAAGLADEAFLGALVLGPDAGLAREAIHASSMPLLTQAGERYTRPVYSEADARRAAEEFARATDVDAARRDRVFSQIAAIRRDAGAIAAVRMAGLVRSEADAIRLAALAREHGTQTLALHQAMGPGVLDLGVPNPGWPEPSSWRAPTDAALWNAGLAAGLVALAFALVIWVGVAGWRRGRGGAPGLVERVDGHVTRLILGRNS